MWLVLWKILDAVVVCYVALIRKPTLLPLIVCFHSFPPTFVRPKSTQLPVAPGASRLQYGRRRNANALPERGHIERIEPILAIISVEILLIFQPKWVIYISKNIFCMIKTCALISNSLFQSVKLSTLYSALSLQC